MKKCEWKIGDVFAYQLVSDLAKEKDLYGSYFLLQKIDECMWEDGRQVPIVYVKITKGANLPSCTDAFDALEYVQTWFSRYEERFWPIDMSRPQEDIAEKARRSYQVDEYGFLPQYRVILPNISSKVMTSELVYIGNYMDAVPPRNEFVPHSKMNIPDVLWSKQKESFEGKLIKRYCQHNLRELSIYKK